MLLLANHKEKKVLFNGKIEIIGRGQLITGRNALAEKSGIPAGSIPRYLEILKNLEMLNIKPNNKFSLITIIKYSDYQDKVNNLNSKPNIQRTSSEHPVNTNNNVNNVNNVNNNTSAEPNTTNQLFKIFYETINPNINYAHKGNRNDAKWLIDKYGLEKTINAAKYAISVQGKQYAPTITTPSQLKNKMSELRIYAEKQKTLTNQPKKGHLIL